MGTPGTSAYVAFTADDFGLSSEVNRAVVRAHREGVLTGASLMVTAGAAEEAVELARAMPSLSVGLHLVLADGRAALAPGRVSRLADAQGRFPKSPIRAGLRWAASAAARRELDGEIEAQFQRFRATGLPLCHVDGHHHLHLHPAVLERVIRLAKRYNVARIRAAHDDLALACRHDPRHRVRMILRWLALGPLIRRARVRLREEGFVVTDRCYGLLETGRMREGYVVRALGQVSGPVEFYFHPTEGPRFDPLGANRGDLQTLLSPAVRRAAERLVRRLRHRDGQTRIFRDPITGALPCSRSL
jgi:hopanoid biosynthesis associated protein HpnK